MQDLIDGLKEERAALKKKNLNVESVTNTQRFDGQNRERGTIGSLRALDG